MAEDLDRDRLQESEYSRDEDEGHWEMFGMYLYHQSKVKERKFPPCVCVCEKEFFCVFQAVS